MQNKLLKTAVAGKLAASASIVSAGGLGKTDVPETTLPEMSLAEIGAPYNIITAPAPASTSITGAEVLEGTIYTQLAANQRIDFVVEGINASEPVTVFLGMSKAADMAGSWLTFTEGQGQLELDPATLELLAAVEIDPLAVPEFPNSLGSVERNHESVVVPIRLSDLSSLGAEGDKVYIQAVAVPVDAEGQIVWERAQASEVDVFLLNTTATENLDVASKTGSSDGDTGTDGDSSTDTGGKTP